MMGAASSRQQTTMMVANVIPAEAGIHIKQTTEMVEGNSLGLCDGFNGSYCRLWVPDLSWFMLHVLQATSRPE